MASANLLFKKDRIDFYTRIVWVTVLDQRGFAARPDSLSNLPKLLGICMGYLG